MKKYAQNSISDIGFYFSSNTDIFRTLFNIWDGVFGENSQRLEAVNYFRKKLRLRYLLGSGYASTLT